MTITNRLLTKTVVDLARAVSDKLLADVVELFERHGLSAGNSRHTDEAAQMVRQAALAYDGQTASVAGNALSKRQLRLLAEMCGDACACVTAGTETCRDCDGSVCRIHSRAQAQARRYRAVTKFLGADATL
jgi:hypothetical protein